MFKVKFCLEPKFIKQLSQIGESAVAFVVAHEYAHHVQFAKSKLIAKAKGNTMRMELQADCFAGVIMASAKNISFDEIKRSDLVVRVFDEETMGSVSFFKELLDEQEHLLVYNKIDVSDKRPSRFDLFVSAKEMDGLGALRKTLDERVSVDKSGKDLTYLVRERHVNIFSEVSSRLDLISSSIKANESLDVVAENLKACRDLLAEVVGIKTSDELLGEIFSSFCIGK